MQHRTRSHATAVGAPSGAPDAEALRKLKGKAPKTEEPEDEEEDEDEDFDAVRWWW